MKTWKTWTAKETLRLEQLRQEGLTVREIALVLGRTRNSVSQRLSALQIRRPSVNRERWYEVLSVARGPKEAAAAMGVTYRAAVAAKRRLRKAGFELPEARR